MKVVSRPNPATPPTTWVVLSDWPEPKPHGLYVCTVGCSQIERRSSSLSTAHAVPVVILFLCTKCMLISKNVLNIANDTWNAPKNQTRGIMVIAYCGNFYEAKRWSHWPQEFELTRLLLENHDPSCEMLRFGRSGHQNLCQTLPIFFHAMWEHATVTQWFLLFSRLYMHFLKLKYQQGLRLWPHPAAELFEVFSCFSRNEWKIAKRHTNYLANTHV